MALLLPRLLLGTTLKKVLSTPRLARGQCNVGLAAAVAGFKAGCHTVPRAVRRGSDLGNDLAAGDEFWPLEPLPRGWDSVHNAPPKKSVLGSISCENTLLYPLYRTAHRGKSKCCFGRERKRNFGCFDERTPSCHLRMTVGFTPSGEAGRILFLCTALLLHITRAEPQIHGVG